MRKLRRLETPHGRVYVYEGGNEPIFMPSVTTILSFEPSQYLQDLEEKIGKEQLAIIGERAAGRGTAMHKFLENYMICLKNGGNSDTCLLYTQKKTPGELLEEGIWEDRIAYGRDLFYNFMHEDTFAHIKKVLFTEKFLFSLEHKFAGTTDFGYVNQSDNIIITDFKSASGLRGEETVNKYKKQGSAYTLAFEETYGYKVSQAQIWISHPEGVQFEVLEKDEMEKKKNEFIELTRAFHNQWDVEPYKEYYYQQKENT